MPTLIPESDWGDALGAKGQNLAEIQKEDGAWTQGSQILLE